jgi:hypothetical protein
MKKELKEEIGYDDYTQKKIKKFEIIEGTKEAVELILEGLSKLGNIVDSDFIEPEMESEILESITTISNEVKRLSGTMMGITNTYINKELTPNDTLTMQFSMDPQVRSINEQNQEKINRIKQLIKS